MKFVMEQRHSDDRAGIQDQNRTSRNTDNDNNDPVIVTVAVIY